MSKWKCFSIIGLYLCEENVNLKCFSIIGVFLCEDSVKIDVFLHYRFTFMWKQCQIGSVSSLSACIDGKTVSNWKCFSIMGLHLWEENVMVEVFLHYRLALMGRECHGGGVSPLLACIDWKRMSWWKCFSIIGLHRWGEKVKVEVFLYYWIALMWRQCQSGSVS